MTTTDRGLPLAKCCACGKAGDVDDLASLQATGRCPRCVPTRALRIKEGPVARAFPCWTLDLAAIRRPEGRQAHAGNYVTTEERR